MTLRMWKILLVTLVAPTLAVLAIELIQSSLIAAGSLGNYSVFVREVLHTGPRLLVLMPAAVALLALAYLGIRLWRQGKAGLPERPRLVTWLILANFLVPVVAVVGMVAYYSYLYRPL